ncbi:hypothetical protein PI95_019820 [Hassallia byssoidea VB512170]|uniref:Uncharacterized protein n=1 Tax=Hassallia byssoidea VB512170 TaxID=1304833 RepID=A0A846HBJ5_9CYAN|nr:hypothetical protein [Hassalia byssoidea]NEU74742.1 hypothetical protein [Hassalia byssoidea VB512170]
MGHRAMGIGLAVRWGGSALVKQRGHVRYPHERLLKGFPGRRAPAVGSADLKHLPSWGIGQWALVIPPCLLVSLSPSPIAPYPSLIR